MRNKTSEIADFANRYGEPYGTNPVYNKKLGITIYRRSFTDDFWKTH